MAGDHDGGDVEGAAPIRILIGSIFFSEWAIMAAVYSLSKRKERGNFCDFRPFLLIFSPLSPLARCGERWSASEEEREKERMWAVVAEKTKKTVMLMTAVLATTAMAILPDLSFLAFFLLQLANHDYLALLRMPTQQLRQAGRQAAEVV